MQFYREAFLFLSVLNVFVAHASNTHFRKLMKPLLDNNIKQTTMLC